MATNPSPSTIDRRDLLAHLIPDPDECLLVAGLAGSAKDSAAWTQEADNLITLGGAMGGAVAMALGIALSAPDKKVAVITGDGELLMNAGVLATGASAAPQNLSWRVALALLAAADSSFFCFFFDCRVGPAAM